MLRLTSLAPDITDAVFRGEEPGGLSLEKLRKGLPVQWQNKGKQRETKGTGNKGDRLLYLY